MFGTAPLTSKMGVIMAWRTWSHHFKAHPNGFHRPAKTPKTFLGRAVNVETDPTQISTIQIRTSNYRAENIPTYTETKIKEDKHLKTALNPKWAFNKARQDCPWASVPEPVPFILLLYPRSCLKTPHTCPLQSLQTQRDPSTPKTRQPKHPMSNVASAASCCEECSKLSIGKTKQTLHRRTAEPRRSSVAGQDQLCTLIQRTKDSFDCPHYGLRKDRLRRGPAWRQCYMLWL